MDSMDEDQLEQSLALYKAQLSHVEQQTAAGGETKDLRILQSDLKELISLTEGSLLSLKKSKLLKSLEDVESSVGEQQVVPGDTHTPMDDEYALFQASLQGDLETEQVADTATHVSTSSATSHLSALTPTSHPSSSATEVESNSNYDPQPSTSHNSYLPSVMNSVRPISSSDSDNDSSSSSDSESDGVVNKGDNTVDEELVKLAGMKCCAPYSHDWGKMDYHNALVMSAVRDSLTDKIMVKVMFTTPTHTSLLPCKFYLDGHCRFNEDKCKYSHGHTVALEELREFVEADHSTLTVGSKCLAHYTDNIWYPATVTEVTDDIISVHFDDYGEDLDVDITQVVPSVPHADDSSDSEDDGRADVQDSHASVEGKPPLSDSEEEEELPTFLWQPPQTTDALGEWENHTRGIGSKLLSKMGYVPGQGLGVRGQGKAEPVPIMLLPQGKSLDRIMELKAMAGNQDLFNAMKKLEKQKRKADKKREEEAASGGKTSSTASPNVFDFINSKLAGKKGDITSLTKAADHTSGHHRSGRGDRGASHRPHISEHDLHKKTDKDINLQVFKTHEEIRNVERQIERLREQLARNENKDRRVAAQVKAKLEEQESYLAKLNSSSSALEKHQKKRSNSKKLTIF